MKHFYFSICLNYPAAFVSIGSLVTPSRVIKEVTRRPGKIEQYCWWVNGSIATHTSYMRDREWCSDSENIPRPTGILSIYLNEKI